MRQELHKAAWMNKEKGVKETVYRWGWGGAGSKGVHVRQRKERKEIDVKFFNIYVRSVHERKCNSS